MFMDSRRAYLGEAGTSRLTLASRFSLQGPCDTATYGHVTASQTFSRLEHKSALVNPPILVCFLSLVLPPLRLALAYVSVFLAVSLLVVMHFGRSHARSKSRSPAPLAYNPTSTLASRPPNFLPPSHYAAAAGLPYTGDTRKANGTSPGPDGLCSASPVAYPTSEDSSSLESAETSSHFGAVGRLIGRTPSKRSTVLLSRSNSKGDKNDKEQDPHDNRKSQLGNIPLLEMHLLPSLRDTVDRMTQPLRQQVEYSELADLRPGSSLHSIASRAPHGTPDPASSTNIPRLRSQPSPAYKSALKSPIRRNALPAATTSIPSPHTTSRRSEPDRSTPLYESTVRSKAYMV